MRPQDQIRTSGNIATTIRNPSQGTHAQEVANLSRAADPVLHNLVARCWAAPTKGMLGGSGPAAGKAGSPEE